MSDTAPGSSQDKEAPSKEDDPNSGPNLVLMYSLIALALLAAIGFALLIVRPFYLRR